MMNEERRNIERKRDDEERLRRLEEAGYESEPRVPWEAEGKMWGRRDLTEDEMRRTGSDRTDYPAGTGSYYSETFVKPVGRASPESEFNEPFRNREPPAHTRELTEEEMRRSGSDRTDYPAGTGSYYSETFVKPYGRASPESYWNEPIRNREPPARRVKAAPETHRKRTERHHPVKKSKTVRHVEEARPVPARKAAVHRELVHDRPRARAYAPEERPVPKTSPFDVRREPLYETVTYKETVPERYVERWEIKPGQPDKFLGERYIGPGESVPERRVVESTPGRRVEERGVFEDEREWVDPRTAGHFRGKAHAAWGRGSESAQRYGTEAVSRSRDWGHRIGEWGRETSHRAGEWGREAEERARESASGRDAEDTAYSAGATIGGALRRMASVSRELSSGFREGMGDEYPERQWEESRERWDEGRDRARERYREEEARHREAARVRPRQSYGEVREIEYGEVEERPPSKRAPSAKKASSSTSAKAKRTGSTAKRKIEKVEEDW
ncbi:hypothetical protein [Methanomassiliicoccus luminyensis]|uniref:hypothetical protein n=1 Tax=Methanomassiliicoccus luminyensis TaxID=1080712 RepID=UPI0011C71C48|nr:hypothetical protein [Methanomassiliicoccus luminyensis]